MLAKEIKEKSDSFFSKIKMESNKSVSEYFDDVHAQWENIIDTILKEKCNANEPIECYVYDLMRAKCMFSSVGEIESIVQEFIALDKKG